MARNIDHFNEIVGLVFDQLYEKFPIRIDIDKGSIASALGVDVEYGEDWNGARQVKSYGELEDGVSFHFFFVEALSWLSQEGFIEATGGFSDSKARLTAKALTAMNAPVAVGENLGSKLSSAVKEAGTEAGRSAIAEAVGQIIGAAVKSMTGGG